VAFSVDGGSNFSHTSGTRAMKSTTASDYMNYGLFSDSADTTAWAFNSSTGAGTNGPTLNPTSNTQTLTLTIYGSIPAGQDVSVASDYTDSVTVAINY
jgi:spore coat protein U-like protein